MKTFLILFTLICLVGFEPNASMHFIHHMIIYGCASPGKSQPVWSVWYFSIGGIPGKICLSLSIYLLVILYRNCGEMALGDYDEDTANPCSTGNTVCAFWLISSHSPKLILIVEISNGTFSFFVFAAWISLMYSVVSFVRFVMDSWIQRVSVSIFGRFILFVCYNTFVSSFESLSVLFYPDSSWFQGSDYAFSLWVCKFFNTE